MQQEYVPMGPLGRALWQPQRKPLDMQLPCVVLMGRHPGSISHHVDAPVYRSLNQP